MEGTVTWQQLVFVAGLTVAVNATTALFVGWLVYKVCLLVGALEKRITRLEMLAEAGAPGTPRGGRG
jgi:fatty acid desaturase